MKRIALIWLALVLAGILCGCSYKDPVIESLIKYESKEFYTSGGFQDYTDYAKYVYTSAAVQDLEDSEYFRLMTAEDVEEILSYIDNFEMWVEIIGGDLQGNYDFNKGVISEGDFLCIKTGGGAYSGQFDSYSVYFFDTEAQTLYYFHNNI